MSILYTGLLITQVIIEKGISQLLTIGCNIEINLFLHTRVLACLIKTTHILHTDYRVDVLQMIYYTDRFFTFEVENVIFDKYSYSFFFNYT